MTFGPRLNPFERADVDDMRLPFRFANGVETIAVLGPIEPDAFDCLTRDAGGEGTDNFLADHAQQARMFVAFVNAVAGCLVDQGAELFGSVLDRSRVQGRGLSLMPVPVHGALTFASLKPQRGCFVLGTAGVDELCWPSVGALGLL
jgi:hypothetical protein